MALQKEHEKQMLMKDEEILKLKLDKSLPNISAVSKDIREASRNERLANPIKTIAQNYLFPSFSDEMADCVAPIVSAGLPHLKKFGIPSKVIDLDNDNEPYFS